MLYIIFLVLWTGSNSQDINGFQSNTENIFLFLIISFATRITKTIEAAKIRNFPTLPKTFPMLPNIFPRYPTFSHITTYFPTVLTTCYFRHCIWMYSCAGKRNFVESITHSIILNRKKSYWGRVSFMATPLKGRFVVFSQLLLIGYIRLG